MIWTVRQAFLIVDAWTRRRVALSAVFAIVLAAAEVAAFGLLYVLINALSRSDREVQPTAVRVLEALGASSSDEQLRLLGLLVVVTMLIKSFGAMAFARWQAGVQNISEARLSTRLFVEYINKDFLFHVDQNSSVLIRNLTGSIGLVATSVIGGVVALIVESFVLLGILVVLAVASPVLALAVGLFAVLLVLGFVLVVGPVVTRAAEQDQTLTAETIQAMQEGFVGIKSVHVYNVNSAVSDKYVEQRYRLAASRATLSFAMRLPQYYLEIALVLGSAGATVVLVLRVGQDRAFALLGLLVVAALRVLPSVGRVLGALSGIRNGVPAVALLRQQVGETPVPVVSSGGETSGPAPTSSAVPGLVLSGVTFGYPAREGDVLRGIDLRIEPGSFVGIVGASGAGKTTLVDLLLGLLRPREGTISVDGLMLTAQTQAAWRSRVGYVPQETFLLDGTLRDNVVFHRDFGPDLDDRVWEALGAAQLADAVRQMPDGLDSRVGERGVRLSGGQRQRLGIARALIARPSVLVLDEATSALDGATEAAVSETINGLRGEMTLIVVAHRLSTLRDCDALVLLEAGRVTAVGTLQELADSSPDFARTMQLAVLSIG